MNAFADIERLLEQWIGLDASTVGQPAVHRAVRQRMQGRIKVRQRRGAPPGDI